MSIGVFHLLAKCLSDSVLGKALRHARTRAHTHSHTHTHTCTHTPLMQHSGTEQWGGRGGPPRAGMSAGTALLASHRQSRTQTLELSEARAVTQASLQAQAAAQAQAIKPRGARGRPKKQQQQQLGHDASKQWVPFVGLDRTIYIIYTRGVYGIFGRDITKYTVTYSVFMYGSGRP